MCANKEKYSIKIIFPLLEIMCVDAGRYYTKSVDKLFYW